VAARSTPRCYSSIYEPPQRADLVDRLLARDNAGRRRGHGADLASDLLQRGDHIGELVIADREALPARV
jgi:hypothetical protein